MNHDIDVDLREYGPEWWAMDREFCTCEHHYDAHLLQIAADGERFAGTCLGPECECRRFTPLDNQ